MRKLKTVTIALFVLILGTLSGCANIQKFDASGYTKACLDANYKGEFDEYVKLTKSTKEEAEKIYKQNLTVATQQFSSVGISDELSEKYTALFTDLFKNVKYTVKEAKEDKDKNYKVEVEIEPAQIFTGVLEATQSEVEAMVTEMAANGTIPSQDEIMEQTFQILYDKIAANMENITYGEKQVIEISVTKDSNNVYSISDEDYLKLDAAMYDIDTLGM